ncbi:hypothetical protein FS837_004089 [Tulasnella sp. UAMH 9824]|nr:hypothetical protein FS837_004089 [Tulasnella sp. UAMH 9824]
MADPPNMEFTAEALDKLKTYAAHLPYSIEPNSEMQNLLDFYLTRITQVRAMRGALKQRTTIQVCVD